MRITAITKQETRDRYNVFVDGEFAVALSAETLLESSWANGDEVTEADLQRFGQRDAYSKLLTKALGLVSRRPQSRYELTTKLTKPDTDSAVVEDVLERMVELGYVDDHAFAKQWVAERGIQRGQALLKQELRRKRIPDAVAEDVLAEFGEQTDQTAAAYELATKRWPRLVNRPNADRRLQDYLLRRGYQHEVVREVSQRVTGRP